MKIWKGLIWLNLSEELPSFDGQINDPVVHAFAGTAPYQRYNIGKITITLGNLTDELIILSWQVSSLK